MTVISCVQDHTTHSHAHSHTIHTQHSLHVDVSDHELHHHPSEHEDIEVSNTILTNNIILALMVGIILFFSILLSNYNKILITRYGHYLYRRKLRRKRLRYELSFSSALGYRAPPISL